MDGCAYAVVDNFWRCRKIYHKRQRTGRRKPGDTCGCKVRREKELRVRSAECRVRYYKSGTEEARNAEGGTRNDSSNGEGTGARRHRWTRELPKWRVSPKGWNVTALGNAQGCGAPAPPFLPPFSPERARRSEIPLAPFQGLQRKQNRAANRHRQRLPWALPRAVTSQPFRLNGHTCQARRR